MVVGRWSRESGHPGVTLARVSFRATVEQLWDGHRDKLIRYTGVSAINVVVGQTLLIVGKSGMGWSAVSANLFAVGLGTIPAYLLSRYWVWKKNGPNRFWAEVVPFWVMAFLGLGLSTLFVGVADDIWGGQLTLNLANFAAFGLLWVMKYLVLDRLLFSSLTEREHGPARPSA